MPWSTPTLRAVREMTRDDISSSLSGAAMIGNSVLRVMSDAMAGLAHLTLRYIDWLALQLLPDSAEAEWLDRHADIWLVNADQTVGRKTEAYAQGIANFTGIKGTIVPEATELDSPDMSFETLEMIVIGDGPTPVNIRALDPGSIGNLASGTALALSEPILGVEGSGATVVSLYGGADAEIDDDLRFRVLLRIREPPMGGDGHDYEQWTLAVNSVTRAWCAPLEMGVGTVTVRFMCDVLRTANAGFPNNDDINAVRIYLDSVRPVTVKDLFVEAPIPEPINFAVNLFNNDNASNRAALESSVARMLHVRAAPASVSNGLYVRATTIYVAWVSDAISEVVTDFDLVMTDHLMPNGGSLAVLGTVTYL